MNVSYHKWVEIVIIIVVYLDTNSRKTKVKQKKITQDPRKPGSNPCDPECASQ